MSCIFASSKYYKEAKLNPFDIAPPIGYDFLQAKSQKLQNHFSMHTGNLIYKQVYDKPHHKVLSTRKMPFDKLQEFFKVSEQSGKVQYISPKLLQIANNQISLQLFLSISSKFIPHWKPQYSMVQLSQILRNPPIQSATYVQDCALSKYFFICEGSDPWRMKYLYQYFNRRIIEYDVQCELINHNSISVQDILIPLKSNVIFEPPSNIENINDVQILIEKINEINKKKDPLYCGVHFYFADFTQKCVQGVGYFQREICHFSLLHYYLAMMTGILADGQPAVIKLCGAFKHKTFQLIFMLRLVFNGKVSLSKNIGSNPFLPDSYIVCEHYNKHNGDFVHRYIVENYDVSKQSGDKKLLYHKRIFKEDLHISVSSFNEMIIRKGILLHAKDHKNNSNTEYYPKKSLFILPKYAIELDNILAEMIKLPDEIEQNWNAMISQNELISEKTKTNLSKPSEISTWKLFAKKKNSPASKINKT